MKRAVRRAQRGFNLVEVLVAIALLGVVTLAITSLFVWGRKNVYSGKQMTTAIAIGTRALEDLAPLTKEDIFNGVFDIPTTATGATVKFGTPEQTYTEAAVRSTNPTLITGYTDLQKQKSTGPKFLDKWNEQLYHDPATKKLPKLLDGTITLVMMPRADTVSNPRFGNSAVLQLRLIVSWSENLRKREVILDSSKTN